MNGGIFFQFLGVKWMKKHFQYESQVESRFLRTEIKLSFFLSCYLKESTTKLCQKMSSILLYTQEFFHFFEVVEHYENKLQPDGC